MLQVPQHKLERLPTGGEPCSRLVVISLADGFEVALGCFRWLARRRRNRAVPETMGYSSDNSDAPNTISYLDSMPAQHIEIKELV
jgi:hypothetical protein